MPPVIDEEICNLCGGCVDDCPGNILAMTDSGPEVQYPEECWYCGNCRVSCPCECILIEFPLFMLV